MSTEATPTAAAPANAETNSANASNAAAANPAPVAGTNAGNTPSSFRDFIGEDGKFKPGWAKTFGAPETLEAKFTEPKALIGSYHNLEKMISAKGIIPPGPNATPEERAKFYDALGRPKTPEEYGIKMPEKIGDKPFPKELWNDAQAGEFAKWAHEQGFNKEQVNKLIEFDALRGLKSYEGSRMAQEQAKAEAVNALKAEWGAQFDAQLAQAKRGAEATQIPELMSHPLANDPVFIKAMAKVGAMIAEQPAAGARGTSHQTINPQAEIDAIMKDKSHPWHPQNQSKDPKAHADAVKYMTRLFELKHGQR